MKTVVTVCEDEKRRGWGSPVDHVSVSVKNKHEKPMDRERRWIKCTEQSRVATKVTHGPERGYGLVSSGCQSSFQDAWRYYYFLSLASVRFLSSQSSLIFI